VLRVLLLFFVLSTALEARADGDGRVPRLRTDDHLVSAAIAHGRARSITFRSLVDRLAASDLIVHVLRQPVLHRPSGVTQFIVATPHTRYVRITLYANDASDPVVALLGHELQHAVEAAEATAVTDQPSYRALYRDIGHASCGPPRWCFDTAEAVAAGARVHAELRAHNVESDRHRPIQILRGPAADEESLASRQP
jgi:hypothetical protein